MYTYFAEASLTVVNEKRCITNIVIFSYHSVVRLVNKCLDGQEALMKMGVLLSPAMVY